MEKQAKQKPDKDQQAFKQSMLELLLFVCLYFFFVFFFVLL